MYVTASVICWQLDTVLVYRWVIQIFISGNIWFHDDILQQWLCTTIAALLQYFFLCVFCWMLAEGIMLYLLVVRVFGRAAEKWYFLLILGWGEHIYTSSRKQEFN